MADRENHASMGVAEMALPRRFRSPPEGYLTLTRCPGRGRPRIPTHLVFLYLCVLGGAAYALFHVF